MDQLKSIAIAGTMMILAPAVASAADMGRPPVHLPPPPIAAPIAESSGWYLRGDIGVGQLGGKTEIIQPGVPTTAGISDDFGGFALGGIGAGYQFNGWLRADITAEYRTKASVSLSDQFCFAGAGGVCNVTPPYTNGFNQITGNISSMVFLANAYLDLGTWHGITPFVGVGVGVASHHMTGFRDIGGTVTTPVAPAVPFGFATGGYLANGSKTNFAWAAMAGLSYDVAQNYKVELGYRYLNMGHVETGNATCFGVPTCSFTVKAKSLDSHEFRVGMRWMLGGPAYAAAPVAMPYPAEPPRVIKRF
jgi:opacity protein-like surface antigen